MTDRDYQPPDLFTMDWHDDIGGSCDYIESELNRLNQRDENEVGFFCWAGLRGLNDGHVAPAMWLNVVGDVFAVIKQYSRSESRNRTLIDRYGQPHRVVYLRRPGDLTKARRAQHQNRGMFWDIDLDYFTQKRPVPDQRYTPMLPDDIIADELDSSNAWVQEVLYNLRAITIALEPDYTGGLTNSLHLLRQWEKAFFIAPLFDKHCAWKENL